MQLQDVIQLLTRYPSVARLGLSFEDLQLFCDIVRWFKDEIASFQPSYITTPPDTLPIKIHNVLMGALTITSEDTKLLWTAVRDLAWEVSPEEDMQRRAYSLIPILLQHAVRQGLGVFNLRPPTRTCHDSACAREYPWDKGSLHGRELGEALEYQATAFSRDFGPVPVRVVSLYCRSCNTRYYPDYCLHDRASTRTYYCNAMPSLIQVAQHYFIAADICEMFANLMTISWTSASNCAKFYNTSLAPSQFADLLPLEWGYKFKLTTEQVWDGFFLYSLLLDHRERGTSLTLPHVASSQADRLSGALHERSLRMAGPGQEYWSHACDRCCWVDKDTEGTEYAVRSVVTDGVGIGHPCCGIHDCKEPVLRTKGARYCREHTHKENECAVLECDLPREEGFRTCATTSHRRLDDILRLENKAMFQLKNRLDRLNTLQTAKHIYSTVLTVDDDLANRVQELSPSMDAQPTSVNMSNTADMYLPPDESELDVRNDEVECEEKSPEGNKRLRALFGRRRTHNEELAVASCGVILGRATFYGSEAVSGVLDFWQVLFPTKRSLPEVLWHDQNCRLWAMLQNCDEETRKFFVNVALPVDVFHFKCKHKESDIECGTHCNPYIWPELRTEDGNWRFNSSAAEQANVWFGKFQAIVREMEVERYNFFLDEVIRRRNRMTVAQLADDGYRPYIIPRDALLG